MRANIEILCMQVVGVPDPRMGEELCAWVKTSQIMNPEDVKNYCRGKVRSQGIVMPQTPLLRPS